MKTRLHFMAIMLACSAVGLADRTYATTISWSGYLEGYAKMPTATASDCYSTIDHQAFHLDVPATITFTGGAIDRGGIFLYLSIGRPTDLSWANPNSFFITPWDLRPTPYSVAMVLGAGDYMLSVNDIENQWDPTFGLLSETNSDNCSSVPYNLTISGNFTPMGRWEGNEDMYPTPFTYTAQVPEPGAWMLGGVAAVTRMLRRKRKLPPCGWQHATPPAWGSLREGRIR